MRNIYISWDLCEKLFLLVDTFLLWYNQAMRQKEEWKEPFSTFFLDTIIMLGY